jgi:mitogen-activated protein kinase 1/3
MPAKKSSSAAPVVSDSKHYSGSHSFLVHGSRFIVDSKYQPLRPIGHGAYGVVCSALDKAKNTKVAIKKIPTAFEDPVDAKRIIREVKLLHHFDHPNCIALESLVVPLEGKLWFVLSAVFCFVLLIYISLLFLALCCSSLNRYGL